MHRHGHQQHGGQKELTPSTQPPCLLPNMIEISLLFAGYYKSDRHCSEWQGETKVQLYIGLHPSLCGQEEIQDFMQPKEQETYKDN